MQRRQGFTTLTDLSEFDKTTWSFLVNVKMTWEYDGIAYLFREAGIPIYGYEKGTTKMNHPVMGMVIPMSKDKNYGVDLYVPVNKKEKARKLISNWERVKECAELEAESGPEHYDRFEEEARANKARYEAEKRQLRKERVRKHLTSLIPFAVRA